MPANLVGYGDGVDLARCVTTGEGKRQDYETCTLVKAFAQNTRDEVRLISQDGQIAGALAAEPGMKQQTYLAVTHPLRAAGADASEDGTGRGTPLVVSPTAATLNSGGNAGGFRTEPGEHLIACGVGVRRLMPIECERLQAFPDDWTRYGDDDKEISDSARYRMLGNAVTVSVVEWIARRIMA